MSVAPLPTDLPARIYPKDQLSPSADLDGSTLVSILFNPDLNWKFVVGSQVASSQIFAYLPAIIASALGISVDQIKPWALQVYIPSSYQSPADVLELGTMWLGYIPTVLVNDLSSQIKAKNSAFYTGLSDPVAKALASRVEPGFNINSVPNPNAGGGNNNNAATDGASSGDKTRQDAIIGVVSTIGAIALLVLVFLVYRSLKRRRELAHRRLSDPPTRTSWVLVRTAENSTRTVLAVHAGGASTLPRTHLEGTRARGMKTPASTAAPARRT
ncbi:hypothetical protein BD779DRAFT_1150957 [Infundibulicybe gibba]|nr:hypothetical protein BD779DRAFT_1150957 [Infundibulicybe gibba]